MDRTLANRVKGATVSLAVLHDSGAPTKQPPFTIVGSGFCVHERGIIVTCAHVLQAFFAKTIQELIASIPDEEKKKELQTIGEVETIRPHAIFYDAERDPDNLLVVPAPTETGFAKTDCDLAMIRVAKHAAFPGGYPVLDIETSNDLYESMEVGTCGFPLGNFLGEQIGTVTSSFTRGTLSSISPAAGAPADRVRYYQLDLTATHGNSGGPVFTWATGKVFGVLEGGVFDTRGTLLPGVAKAEPVYKALQNQAVERLVNATMEDLNG